MTSIQPSAALSSVRSFALAAPVLPVLLRSQIVHRGARGPEGCAENPTECDQCLEMVARYLAREMNWEIERALNKPVGSYRMDLGEDVCSLERAKMLRWVTARICVIGRPSISWGSRPAGQVNTSSNQVCGEAQAEQRPPRFSSEGSNPSPRASTSCGSGGAAAREGDVPVVQFGEEGRSAENLPEQGSGPDDGSGRAQRPAWMRRVAMGLLHVALVPLGLAFLVGTIVLILFVALDTSEEAW